MINVNILKFIYNMLPVMKFVFYFAENIYYSNDKYLKQYKHFLAIFNTL